MTGEGGAHAPSDEGGSEISGRIVDVFPTLPRAAWVLMVLSVGGVGIGLAKLDRARRGLTPPSIGAHGDVVSPYEAAFFVRAGSGLGVAIAVLMLVVAYKR